MILAGHSVEAVAFSPDGRTLASAGVDGTVRLWDPGTGTELAALRLGTYVTSVDWGPDGSLLAVGFDSYVTGLRVKPVE